MASGQYSIAKHTLLPLIYTIKTASSFTYLLRDPETTSLLMLPTSAPRHDLRHHVENIEKEFKCKLTHTFTNSPEERERGKLFDEDIVTSEQQGDLRPLLVGELSVCYIKAAGYRPDYSLHAIIDQVFCPVSRATHIGLVTKLPYSSSIDLQKEIKASLYCQTLNKLKYFPNQTLIFPDKKTEVDDLEFAKALGGSEMGVFLDEKIQTLRNSAEENLIPTSMLSEKMLNPFLSPEKYSSLLKASDRSKCFDILRRMRQQWKK